MPRAPAGLPAGYLPPGYQGGGGPKPRSTKAKSKARNNSPAKASLLESFSEESIRAMADFLGGL